MPFGPLSGRQKVPDAFLPLRRAGANPRKSPPAGLEKMAASVPILFRIFMAPRGASADVQTRSGMCVNTSIFTFIYLFSFWEEIVIFNTITKQDEEGQRRDTRTDTSHYSGATRRDPCLRDCPRQSPVIQQLHDLRETYTSGLSPLLGLASSWLPHPEDGIPDCGS